MIPISEGGGGLTATPLSFGAINLGNLDTDPDTTTSNVGDIYYNTAGSAVKLLVNEGGGLVWRDIGYNIQITKSQVVGTAVTLSDTGTITSGMIGDTQVTVSKLSTSSVTNAKVATNAAIDATKIAGTAAVLSSANTFTVGGHVVKTGADATAGLQIWRNSVTQSAALLSVFQSDGSTVLAQVSAAGNVSLRNDNGAAAGVPLSITANATQSVNLFQVLGSDNSTVRAAIGSTGALTVSPSSGTAATINAAASAIGLVVKANATTPGNIQEWQNSGGTALANVNNAGVIRGTILQSSGADFDARTLSSGGAVTLLRATSTPSNPGANYARLYFRDGTTTGTLKLVVRAGAAGAETTILDNIPQT